MYCLSYFHLPPNSILWVTNLDVDVTTLKQAKKAKNQTVSLKRWFLTDRNNFAQKRTRRKVMSMTSLFAHSLSHSPSLSLKIIPLSLPLTPFLKFIRVLLSLWFTGAQNLRKMFDFEEKSVRSRWSFIEDVDCEIFYKFKNTIDYRFNTRGNKTCSLFHYQWISLCSWSNPINLQIQHGSVRRID